MYIYLNLLELNIKTQVSHAPYSLTIKYECFHLTLQSAASASGWQHCSPSDSWAVWGCCRGWFPPWGTLPSAAAASEASGSPNRLRTERPAHRDGGEKHPKTRSELQIIHDSRRQPQWWSLGKMPTSTGVRTKKNDSAGSLGIWHHHHWFLSS